MTVVTDRNSGLDGPDDEPTAIVDHTDEDGEASETEATETSETEASETEASEAGEDATSEAGDAAQTDEADDDEFDNDPEDVDAGYDDDGYDDEGYDDFDDSDDDAEYDVDAENDDDGFDDDAEDVDADDPENHVEADDPADDETSAAPCLDADDWADDYSTDEKPEGNESADDIEEIDDDAAASAGNADDHAEHDPELISESGSASNPDRATTPAPGDARGPLWSGRQLTTVIQRVLAVFVVTGMLGYGFGAARGSSYVARTEFVYTLDESVPDSFLREDRRLLTQVVTFKSDAVLTPVAQQFDLTVDELRTRIDVETLNLSEVLRLDVSDGDPEQAVAISRAVLDRYLQVITDATPAGDSTGLDQRRFEVAGQLAVADAARRVLLEAEQRDGSLEIEQESIQRQIDLKDAQINRIQGSLDDALVQTVTAGRLAGLNEQLALSQEALASLELELSAVAAQRAALVTDTTAEPALLREIQRLESKLNTIDDELAERELGPLVASPIRELSEPLILFRSVHIFGLQGMAIGLLVGVPLAALVAYRTRRRQLWFD